MDVLLKYMRKCFGLSIFTESVNDNSLPWKKIREIILSGVWEVTVR